MLLVLGPHLLECVAWLQLLLSSMGLTLLHPIVAFCLGIPELLLERGNFGLRLLQLLAEASVLRHQALVGILEARHHFGNHAASRSLPGFASVSFHSRARLKR